MNGRICGNLPSERPAQSKPGGKGGGGRPDFAQGGGPEGDKLEAALAAVKKALAA